MHALEWEKELDSTPGVTVHLAAIDSRLGEQLSKAARKRAMALFRLDLDGVVSWDELAALLGREFLFPYEVRGVDAIVDLLSDLDWLENEAGYVVLLRRTEEVPNVRDILRTFFLTFPQLSRRWQARGIPFHIVVSGNRFVRSLVTEAISSEEEVWAGMKSPWVRKGRPVTLRNHADTT